MRYHYYEMCAKHLKDLLRLLATAVVASLEKMSSSRFLASGGFCTTLLLRLDGSGPHCKEAASDRTQPMIIAIDQGILLQSNHDETYKADNGAWKCPPEHVCRVCG